MKFKNTAASSELVTLQEAAAYFGISVRTLYLHAQNGTGPQMHLGPDGRKRPSITSLNTWALGDLSTEFDLNERLDFLSAAAAAQVLECSVSTLNHWRSNRNAKNILEYGPRFFRIGKHVVYLLDDLLPFKARFE